MIEKKRVRLDRLVDQVLVGVSVHRTFDWDELSGHYLRVGFGVFAVKVWIPKRAGQR